MNKKIKLLLSLATFLIVIMVANVSFCAENDTTTKNGDGVDTVTGWATQNITQDETGITTITKTSSNQVNIVRWSHIDNWTGEYELMPTNGSTSDAIGATLCVQKGGTLRFTPDGIKTGLITTSSRMHSNYELCRDNAHGVNSGDANGYYQADAIKQAAKNDIANKLQSTISNFEGAEPNQGNGVWAKYGNSVYNYKEILVGDTSVVPGQTIIAASKAYTREQEYSLYMSAIEENSNTAYMLSSGKSFDPVNSLGLKRGNYQGTKSDIADTQLVQNAIWASDFNQGHYEYKGLEAQGLVEEAKAYEKIVDQLKDYKASFADTNPQTIVNRETEKYIIGPYKLQYPSDTRFSYIQDMYLIDEKGNKIEAKDFKVICSSSKVYPLSGENFFVEFNKEVGEKYNKVGIKAEFAYLSLVQAQYDEYKGSGKICQLVGTCEQKSYTRNFTYTRTEWHDELRKVEVSGEYDATGATKTKWETVSVYGPVKHNGSCNETWYEGYIYEVQVGTYDSQEVIVIKSALREWKTDKIATTPNTIDLRMELGGYVWVDDDNGKQSVANGEYERGEKRVPNIIVELYSADNKHVATTKTDSDGEYRFKNLNAMKKYYIKFIYNGEYYQPTYYTSPTDSKNGWGKGNWENNSNATDIRTLRENFNNKFATIGSNPNNYGTNKQTFTRQELLQKSVIDEFGNLKTESSSDSTIQKMIEYVKDCRMDAYTGSGDGTADGYPTPSIFNISSNALANRELLGKNLSTLYPAAYYINLGLNPREEADVAIKKDIDKVVLEINGQKQEYTYNTLENKENAEQEWDISVRLSDLYYNTNYTRALHTSDYLYNVQNSYGDKCVELGKTENDELKIFVTYKIMVRNQSMSIRTKINEIVDYYDNELTYIKERSYIEIKTGENKGKYDVKAQNTSIYGANSESLIEGYNKLYVEGLNDKYLAAGQTAYIYLTFEVGKNEDGRIILDEQVLTGNGVGVGKENIVEINGYSTIYAPGTKVPNVGDVSLKVAGIVDRDSNPGNLNTSNIRKDGNIDYSKFEDDTDKAPNLKIVLDRDGNDRQISGIAWEDERTKTVQLATIGDGIMQENETKINGIKVQLVELMENGKEFIWRTFEGTGTKNETEPIINYANLVSNYKFENKEGAYAFKSFVPGKYVVRFIYGDTIENVVPSSLNMGGLNEKSYNGQDYKTTTYQTGIDQSGVYEWRNVAVTGIDNSASNNETATYLYDIHASDKTSNVSDAKDIGSIRERVNKYSSTDVTNYISEVLASHKADYKTMYDRNTLLQDLMKNTAMTAETGLMVVEVEYNQDAPASPASPYKIENVNLGLEERPKAQIKIEKEVANVKIILADGSVLFDAKQTAPNVLWSPRKITLTMDEELMHGATIKISYKIKATNVGEVDYKDNLFYYTGKLSNTASVVTTKVDKLIDYVENNLQFYEADNNNWKTIKADDVMKNLVNEKLTEEVEKYNTIIITNGLSDELVPTKYKQSKNTNIKDSTEIPLILTQLITSENEGDDLIYRNLVEAVSTSNTVGRRMDSSVVGNQNPTKNPEEQDSAKAEEVNILPPYGDVKVYIIIGIILTSVLIIITGIIFIKKKVISK